VNSIAIGISIARFPDLRNKIVKSRRRFLRVRVKSMGSRRQKQRTGGIGVRESEIRESSDSRPREYRFPDREIPDKETRKA
jgi:hypothetical protein